MLTSSNHFDPTDLQENSSHSSFNSKFLTNEIDCPVNSNFQMTVQHSILCTGCGFRQEHLEKMLILSVFLPEPKELVLCGTFLIFFILLFFCEDGFVQLAPSYSKYLCNIAQFLLENDPSKRNSIFDFHNSNRRKMQCTVSSSAYLSSLEVLGYLSRVQWKNG